MGFSTDMWVPKNRFRLISHFGLSDQSFGTPHAEPVLRVEHPREGNIASHIWAKATHAVSGPTVRPIALTGTRSHQPGELSGA
jgi:hypothetical protein